jgi:uncharacterized protein
MLVVADTSALMALAACDSLALLTELFREVRVPSAVFQESTVSGKPHADELREFLEDKVTSVNLTDFVVTSPGLGIGELQAMVLYKQLHADRLLIDDGRARRVAKFNKIAIVGSIGVLVLAKNRALIPALRPRLAAINSAGIYLSEPLVQQALRLVGEER